MLGEYFTAVPGASKWFWGGVISYDNSVKVEQLGVTAAHVVAGGVGAVSEEVAFEMAAGVASRLHTNIGIGITGIAGPGGGTEEKPVGTVWIGIHIDGSTTAQHFRIPGDRAAIRRRSCTAAMHLLRSKLA
jgi:nicotinamide-nucleotide amidase